MHKKAALEAAKQKITLNQYVMKAINQSFESKESIKETVIYIPYGKKQMNWESYVDTSLTTMYHDKPIWSKKLYVYLLGN